MRAWLRREERARKAKQRKRMWMVKLYQNQAALEGGSRGGGAPDLDIDVDQLGEGEVDDLLNWSQHLDFEAYMDDWTSMACSLGTEAFVAENDGEFLSELPGPGTGLALGLMQSGVPRQPYKQTLNHT